MRKCAATGGCRARKKRLRAGLVNGCFVCLYGVMATMKFDKKKFKDRSFAAGVDREDVLHAAEALGVDLKEHIQFVIEAMREVAGELGLDGKADET